MINTDVQNKPFKIKLICTEKNGKPAIEVRRLTTNMEIIKTLVWCAINEQPVTFIPCFTDKIKSLATLQQKGVIFLDKEDGLYRFTL